mmetsp:Transcript_15339/g.33120  ORF Transcript_15339/g.33120 Transcript_15339/m.33120 type:complete len:389 (-) Transcript_15339:537-1703(-)
MGEVRCHLSQACAHSINIVVRQRGAEFLRQSAKNHPVGTGLAGRDHSCVGHLGATLRVDVSGSLLGVCSGGKNHVGPLGSLVAVRAHVDHEGVGRNFGLIVVVRVEEEHNLRGCRGRRLGRAEPKVQTGHAACGIVKDVETIPVGLNHTTRLGDSVKLLQKSIAVLTGHNSGTHNHHGRVCGLEGLAERMFATSQLGQGLRARAELLNRKREVQRRPDVSNYRTTRDVGTAETGVQDRGLRTKVGTHEQHGVSLLYTQNGRVHQVAGANVCIQGGESLAGVVAAAQLVEQVLHGNNTLGVSKLPCNCLHLVSGNVAHRGSDSSEGIFPRVKRQAVLALHHGRVKTLALEAIILETGLVGDPLLVHLLVQAGSDAHHLRALGVDTNGCA